MRNFYVLGVAVAALAFAGLGAECGEPIIGDEDGGVTDGGETSCRETGTCIPDKYEDTDQGLADTADYYDLLLNTQGDILSINAFAEGDAIAYWLASPVDANDRLINIWPEGDTIVNKIYVFPEGSGRSIINVGASDTNYSPLLQVWHVDVPEGYVAGTLKSEQAILDSAADADTGITVTATNDILAIAIVDPDVGLAGTGGPALEQFWVDGFTVSGYNFPGGNTDGTIPVSESSDPAQTPPDPFFSVLYQFAQTGGGGCPGANVYSAKYGDPEYSPVPVTTYLLVPAGECDQIPTSETEVLDLLQDATYTENPNNSDIVIVAPQRP